MTQDIRVVLEAVPPLYQFLIPYLLIVAFFAYKALKKMKQLLLDLLGEIDWGTKRGDALRTRLLAAIRSLDAGQERSEAKRCPHGVWAADHCFKCQIVGTSFQSPPQPGE